MQFFGALHQAEAHANDRSKKVEHGAVVPHVVSAAFELCIGDIGDEPMDLFCREPESRLGHVNSGLRNIEYGDVLISLCKEVINEGRFASANVNDGCRISGIRALYKSKRGFKVRTVPTDRFWCLGRLDSFPMRLCIHGSTPTA
jgi:hypothetical protein